MANSFRVSSSSSVIKPVSSSGRLPAIRLDGLRHERNRVVVPPGGAADHGHHRDAIAAQQPQIELWSAWVRSRVTLP
jgi:hypothetical protein